MDDKTEHNKIKMPQIIELDVAPLQPRPETLIPAVLTGTGIPVRSPISTRFGNWTWDYSDIAPELWDSAITIIKDRIYDLYTNKHIRYGAWE